MHAPPAAGPASTCRRCLDPTVRPRQRPQAASPARWEPPERRPRSTRAFRTKLGEFRTHLKLFERAAGSNAAASQATLAKEDRATSAAPSVMPDSPAATMAPAAQAKAAVQAGHADADKHLDAISAILNKSKTGTLTKIQTAALKKHVAELRLLLQASN